MIAAIYMTVTAVYRLSTTAAEREALREMLATC